MLFLRFSGNQSCCIIFGFLKAWKPSQMAIRLQVVSEVTEMMLGTCLWLV